MATRQIGGLRRLPGAVYLLLATLAALHGSAAGKYASPYCPTTGDCSCNFIETDHEFDCPPVEPDISVRIKPNERVHIDCPTNKDNVYERLPRMQLGNIPMVRIQKCPTPAGGTAYLAILSRLGMQHTRTLMLSNGGSALVRQHLTGLVELERLIIQKNHLTELPDDLFADVRNLTWLDMRSNSVHLTVNLFRDLEKLEYLELGYNSIKSLRPGMFHSQRRLHYLNLWGNSLRYLTQAELEGLASVQDLDLSGNDLETMEVGVFDGMAGLSNVHLSSNPLRALPDGLLAHTKNLTRFTLTNNRVAMETLPARLFAELPALERVEVVCGLERLPGDLFAGTVNVTNVTLAENLLSTLPVEIFRGLRRLLELDLSGNQLVQLEDGMFDSLEALVVLRLSNNRLTTIADDLLTGLSSLTELYADGNHLQTIGGKAFHTCERLHNLQLANNQLSLITEIEGYQMIDSAGYSQFQYLTALRTLNLRNNSLTTMLIDWTLFNKNLTLIDVSHNRIQKFSVTDLQSFAAAGSTIVTNLTHNALQTVDFDLLDKQQQQHNLTFNVYLDHNPIQCNCNLIRFVQYLHGRRTPTATTATGQYDMHLEVGGLRCAGPDALHGRLVSSLRDNELLCPLDMPNASTRHCPAPCACFVRPVDLALIVNCTNAGLTSVPELPLPTRFLLNSTELYVEHNRITALPSRRARNATQAAAVSAPPNAYDYVTEIHASHNNISALRADNIPPMLRVLNVRHNRLVELTGSVLQQFNRTRRLHHISLGHNPWRCDCAARELLLFVQNHGTQRIPDVDTVHCAAAGVGRLQELLAVDVCPADHTLLVLASLVMLLFGLSIGTLVAFYYKYEHEVKVWLFAHNLLTSWVSELEVDGGKEFDAFVSYSQKDYQFVSERIVRELEHGAQPYRLCIHERDWLVGGAITQSIAESVEKSRRTLIVLTKNFVESDWGRMEFRVAHKNALLENRARVIIIVVGELSDMKLDSMDAEMKAYLQTNTYIKWGDPWFWDKLRYALPHHRVQPSKPHQQQQHRMKALQGTEDKLDLIAQQSPPTPPPMTTPPAELANQKFGPAVAGGGALNGTLNGHVNGAFIINANAKQSDV